MGVAVPDTRLHPVYLVIETAKTLRSAIPFLVVTILGGAPWWVNAILFVLIMVVAVAQWHVKKYSVISGVLRLRSGLFNRTVRVVPITRITALDAYRSLTQRLVGVWGSTCSPRGSERAAVVPGEPVRSRLDDCAAPGVRATTGGPRRPGAAVTGSPGPRPGEDPRCLAWRRDPGRRAAGRGRGHRRAGTEEMLIAAITNNSIPLIFAAAMVVWYRFSEYVPSRAQDFMTQTVEPRGILAVVTALVVVAVVAGVVLGACGSTGSPSFAMAMCCATAAACSESRRPPSRPRIQAVRVVEGIWRPPIGYASLQVEVAGIGRRTPTNARSFRSSAPTGPSLWSAARCPNCLARRPAALDPRPHVPALLTLPLEYGAGFGCVPAVSWLVATPGNSPATAGLLWRTPGPREARWQVEENSVLCCDGAGYLLATR